MKRPILTISTALLTITMLISSCGDSDSKPDSSKTPTGTTKEQYQCPMKCTEQVFDKPGKCPVCDMELEKVSKS